MKNYRILIIIGVILSISGGILKLLGLGIEYSKYIGVALLLGSILCVIGLYFFITKSTEKK